MTHHSEHGSALVTSIISVTVALTLAYAALSVATSQQSDASDQLLEGQAADAAEAGVYRAIEEVRSVLKLDPWDPTRVIDTWLFDSQGDPVTWEVARDEAMEKNGRTYAAFTVQIHPTREGDDRLITITATGRAPAERPRAQRTVQAVLRIHERPSEVFDHGYFVDHWGWFYGDTITSHGNVGANGMFDVSGYAPEVHGTPRFDDLDGTDLIGYQDDNGDGLEDGLDGGIYSGWDVAHGENVLGMGGDEDNQHDSWDRAAMPNLQRLDTYEADAVAAGSTIHLGGQVDEYGNPADPLLLADAVVGDTEGEPEHLVLIGTEDQPIILDGPIVVRGDVIVKGYVTGRGAIYAGRNVYVADDVHYLDGPTSLLPLDNTEAATEQWLADNAASDFLGLYAKEHVVLGDYTDNWWQWYVGTWIGDEMNASGEDHGRDHLPGTRAGRDGIPYTNDDDRLEGDLQWSVKRYTWQHAELGLIPDGFQPGDPIPGSGEDADGDGVFDDIIGIDEFNLAADLGDETKWAGNMPEAICTFDELSSAAITHVDGALYTNHALAMYTAAQDQELTFFGSVTCRNESIVYGTNRMNLVHDRRLLGGGLSPDLLPRSLAPLEILAWRIVSHGDIDSDEVNPWF